MINMEEILDCFVERIQDIMFSKKWNIKQFAEYVEIPRRTVNSWILKKRSPRIDYIYQIADRFGYSIDYLVGKEN